MGCCWPGAAAKASEGILRSGKREAGTQEGAEGVCLEWVHGVAIVCSRGGEQQLGALLPLILVHLRAGTLV